MAKIKTKIETLPPPKHAVKNPAATRNGNAITCKWTVPSDLSKNNKYKATGLRLGWWQPDGTLLGTRKTQNVGLGTTQKVIAISRDKYHPYTSRTLGSVSCSITAYNGNGVSAKSATAVYRFYAPRPPEITAPAIDTQTGIVSCTITTNAGDDNYERKRTEAKRTVTNTRLDTVTETNITHTATSYTDEFDATDYQQLSYDEYICYQVRARAQGIAGSSAWRATEPYYLSYPKQATIQGIDVSSTDSTGKVTVRIDTNATTEHPVDKVVLEALADCEYANVSDIPAGAMWDETGSIDNGACTALTAAVSDLMPQPGNYTWVRVKSSRAIEGVLYRYSEYQRVTALEQPARTAVGASIDIVDVKSGDDGESAVVLLGWNASGSDDTDGTELTWSDDAGAWKSTDEPDSYEFTWSDGELVDGTTTYHDSAEIRIKGLDGGVPVYIRARRYTDADTRTFSAYSDTWSIIPSAAPTGVTLMAKTYIPAGEPLEVEWTFGGGGVQRSWMLCLADGTPIPNAGRNGTEGSHTIPAELVEQLAVDDELTLYVEVSTGGDPARSADLTVTIQQPPTLAVSMAATSTSQPLSFSLTASEPCSVVASLASDGTEGQLAGAIVWSDVSEPAWTASNGAYTATVELPYVGALRDGVGYTLSAYATSDESGLQSERQTAHTTIGWTHKAPYPDGYATVTPYDAMDSQTGVHRIGATIELDATIGEGAAASTDVFDIYRVTADGASLIGEGYPLAYTVDDDFAPFGTDTDLSYRVVIRTADGDTDYTDVYYDLPADYMRLDWGGGYVELPYNINIADAYAKDVEVRKHADGQSAAYYNGGVSRSGKLTSTMVRADGDGWQVRGLANHAGAVFVRTPDGAAYEADVQVTDISTEGVLYSLSISTDRVSETAAYMLPIVEEDDGE